MRKFLKFKTILIIVTVVFFAGVVYAATSYSVPAGGGTTQVDEWSICRNITNNNTLPLFVPTNSSAEWNSLVSNGSPNVSLGSCVSTCSDPQASNNGGPAPCIYWCWQGPVNKDWSCPGYSGACSPLGSSHYTKCFSPAPANSTYFLTLNCLESPTDLNDFDCAGP